MPTPRIYESSAARQKAYRRRQACPAEALPAASPISAMPSTRRWTAMRRQAQGLLNTLRQEMEAYLEARSEDWQEGPKGQAMEESVESIDDLLTQMEEI